MKQTRMRTLRLRLDDDEVGVLDRVATEHGIDRATCLRMLLMKEHRKMFGPRQQTAPSQKSAGPLRRDP